MQYIKEWEHALGTEMEKLRTRKFQNNFWFVVLASSFGCLLLYTFTVAKDENSLLIFLGQSFGSGTSEFQGTSHNDLSNEGIHVRQETQEAKNPLTNIEDLSKEGTHVREKTQHAKDPLRNDDLSNDEIHATEHAKDPLRNHDLSNGRIHVQEETQHAKDSLRNDGIHVKEETHDAKDSLRSDVLYNGGIHFREETQHAKDYLRNVGIHVKEEAHDAKDSLGSDVLSNGGIHVQEETQHAKNDGIQVKEETHIAKDSLRSDVLSNGRIHVREETKHAKNLLRNEGIYVEEETHDAKDSLRNDDLSYEGIYVGEETHDEKNPLITNVNTHKEKHAHSSTTMPIKNLRDENVAQLPTKLKDKKFDQDKVELVGSKSKEGRKYAKKGPARLKKNGARVPTFTNKKDPCSGRYIYIHDLPSLFNEDIIKDCVSLNKWFNMCDFVENLGFGPILGEARGIFLRTGWYATNQFLLEVIFHNKMKQYKCLTNDSSMASAIYVPYYSGLDVSRYLWISNLTVRDSVSLELVKWLREKPEWQKMWGRDHFMVAGRITWDFRRENNNADSWGNQLLILPETHNMTVLTIEKSPWGINDFAIPYPTYFHPTKSDQVYTWQSKMKKQKRPYLFCFVGAPRPGLEDSIRGKLFEQCHLARNCYMLQCTGRHKSECIKPAYVMQVFENSNFCLQPQGDSYTRKSIFDSLLAGCIPVFFHPGSAYVQYLWHLPKDYESYSVFIPEHDIRGGNVSIKDVLERIPEEKVKSMRAHIIKLIPKIIYADPGFRLDDIEDAFDISIKRVLGRIDKLRRELSEKVDYSGNGKEKIPKKHALSPIVAEHKWENFFV